MNSRLLHHAAFAVGLAVLGWIAAGYLAPLHALALAVTLLVGAFYLMGAWELQRFRQATASLLDALAALKEPPATLAPWLARLHPSLQSAVRLRIEGERIALPGPAMAPYLAGLLVLLGMLGTFLGMVVTLRGTGVALDSATDLQAVRAALSAPVKGLGLAFGTSVAGVAASAMLGLMSALSRRERLQAAQALDAHTATTLRAFSLAHQREASLQLMQRQAELMPALVDRLDALMQRIEQQGQSLGDRLAGGQEQFHRQTEVAYAALATSVDSTLRQSLAESARLAGATLQPAVEATMAGIARESAALQRHVGETVQQQLADLSARVAQTFEQRSAALLQSVDRSHGELQATLAARDEQRLAAWTQALEASAATLHSGWQQAGEQSQAHTREIVAEVARLMDTASQAPRAAAEVIAELRHQLSDSMARDNAMLEERGRLLHTLGSLLDTLNHASAEQRGAIDGLVASSAALLENAGARFAEQSEAEGRRLAEAAAQLTGSAAEVASLGEAFGLSVQLFSESNDKLAAQLQRIEGALSQSMARSDEQLAYYVAQAREIIDLSLMSQKQIVEDLQQLGATRRAPALDEA